MGWRLRDFDEVAWWIVYPLGIAAGYCHILQAQIADCYRTLHLFFVNGRAKSELEEVETLKADYAKLTWRENWFQKIVLIFYINHTASQQFFSPQMRAMRRRINTLYPNTDVPEALATEYRQMSRPLLKYTNILTFNTRVAVLFLALLVDEVWIYYLFDITVMNILLIYMIVKYEKVCKRFNELLDKE